MFALPFDLLDTVAKGDGYLAEDFVDKLNSQVTVYILVLFALITGCKLNFGSPIQCMMPAESTDSWRLYYHHYCYVQPEHKQYLDFNPRIRYFMNTSMWRTKPVFYQWVPYILIAQAVFFLIPRWFWKFVGTHICYGTDIETVMMELNNICAVCDKDGDDQEAMKRLAKFLCDMVDYKRRKKTWGFSLTLFYVIRKWSMFVNVIFQFVFLSGLIAEIGDSTDYFWGFNLLQSSLFGTVDNPVMGFFPNVVRCNLNKSVLGNHIHSTLVQCVLLMNFINEKVFLLIYFWLLALAVINLFSAIRYTVLLTVPRYRTFIAEGFIPPQQVLMEHASALIGGPYNHVQGRHLLDFFINSVLRTDGVLILMFIYNLRGAVLSCDVIQLMWNIAVQPSFKEDDIPRGTSFERLDAFGGKGSRLIDDNGNEIKRPPRLIEEPGFVNSLKPSAPEKEPLFANEDTLPQNSTFENEYSSPPHL